MVPKLQSGADGNMAKKYTDRQIHVSANQSIISMQCQHFSTVTKAKLWQSLTSVRSSLWTNSLCKHSKVHKYDRLLFISTRQTIRQLMRHSEGGKILSHVKNMSSTYIRGFISILALSIVQKIPAPLLLSESCSFILWHFDSGCANCTD